MTNTTRPGRRTPKRDDVTVVSWLFSRRIWVGTLVFAGLLVATVILVGLVGFGSDPLSTAHQTLSVPLSLLVVFLGARGMAMVLAQTYRDRRVRAGEHHSGTDVSTVAMLTVASFSIVGLLAAGVAFPFLVQVSGLSYVVAAGVAALVLPITYPLLVHQLSERLSFDRYRRGYHVTPAVWTFVWTLPLVVLAWFLSVGHPAIPVEVPPSVAGVTMPSRYVGATVFVDAWDLAYVALVTPTVLAYIYPVRQYAERFIRALLP
jgi:hypothetical protein